MSLVTFSQELQALVSTHSARVLAVQCGRYAGSAWLWDTTLAVTVEHVIGTGVEVHVASADGPLAARVVATLPGLDLALLRLERELEVRPVPSRVAAEVQPGEFVIALARSAEDGTGVSTGVVACRSGAWTTPRGGRAEHFLQPDLQLYPGYSGGPLLDVTGRFLGLNTRGLSRYQPITLTAETVNQAVEQMLRGQCEPAYLGVGLHSVELPRAFRERFQWEAGAMVVNLEESSPAARAGVLPGDILIQLGEVAVNGTPDVLRELQQLTPGQLLATRWIRAGQLLEVDITTSRRPRSGAQDSD